MNGMNIGDTVTAKVSRKSLKNEGMRLAGVYKIVCRDSDGALKWKDSAPNLVVNTGLDYALDSSIGGGTQLSFFLGLTDGTPTVAAGDTSASHVGWVEIEDYDEATRIAFTPAAVSGQSVDNAGNEAVFTMNAAVTVGGAFLISVSTKGGSTGTLFSAAAFAGGDKVLGIGDTITVTYALSASDV
jgi:hypothetical protein